MGKRDEPSDFPDNEKSHLLTRRKFIESTVYLSGALAGGALIFPSETVGENASAAIPATTPPASPTLPKPIVPNEVVLAQKDPSMKVLTERPLTANITAEYLNDAITPTNRLFIRNNLLTPDISAAGHTLTIKGLVFKPTTFTLEELRHTFTPVTMQGMLECAGSGRTAFQPLPKGTPWHPTGGFGCPQWTGIRLKDVLAFSGVKTEAVHVAFFGADFGEVPTAPPMVRSIPLSKAMDPHTLIVWAINGEPLPKIHGFPLRMVVPGWVASASVKWLVGIEVLDQPFRGSYMDDSYRIPVSPVTPGTKMPKETVSTEAWPVKSVITSPPQGMKYKLGEKITVSGKAWAGDDDIVKVEVSLDEGATWVKANLDKPTDKYAWTIFYFSFSAPRTGYLTILARAMDSKGNLQPISGIWNPLGYFWNGIPRVGIVIEKS